MKKHKLDLELALPSDAVACDACVGRMVEALGATRGITRVHVDREDPARPKLCLHYEPTSVRIEEVEALVQSTLATTTVSPSALGEAERDLRSARREPLPKRPRIR